MIIGTFDIPFVIGFLVKDEYVLMIKRNKEPWINRWNGAGGKIEKGESAREAIVREIKEETTVNLKEAGETRYAGIVTWDFGREETYTRGMIAFVSYLSEKQPRWHEDREIREGILAWKKIDWVCDKENTAVAHNLPHFLPAMLEKNDPMQYHCIFQENKLQKVVRKALPDAFKNI